MTYRFLTSKASAEIWKRSSGTRTDIITELPFLMKHLSKMSSVEYKLKENILSMELLKLIPNLQYQSKKSGNHPANSLIIFLFIEVFNATKAMVFLWYGRGIKYVFYVCNTQYGIARGLTMILWMHALQILSESVRQ